MLLWKCAGLTGEQLALYDYEGAAFTGADPARVQAPLIVGQNPRLDDVNDPQ
jgi:hypothetical protein